MRVSRLAGWWLALSLICGGAAQAQALSFVEPAAATVRGQVPVRVDLGAGYEKGYVVFYLGEPGKPLRFKMATVADRQGLFGFDWDTQAPDAKVPDGEYRILAIGYSAAGEVVGQKAVTLVVQNEVTTSSLPTRGILLRYNLTPGREARFLATTQVRTEAVEGEKGDYGMFNGGVMAFWNSRVLSRNPDGKAQVRNTVYSFAERSARNKIKPMEANGKSVSLMMASDGDLVRRTDQDVLFPIGELGLEFPEQPVKIGDSWRSRLRFLVDGRTAREDTVIANHTLSSVVWKAGYRTAVIDSTFEAGPYNVELKGEDKENAEWLAGVTIIIKGHRRTYFAYQPEVGRVLQIEEDQQQFCTLDFEEPPPAAAMGAGMPGMEGMPGMSPGGMPPGMPGAVPGAMPGAGMPGAPGAGMGQPAPVVEKPAGFDKGSTAFRRATPPAAAATAGMAAPGMVAGPPPEPPKVDVAHFKRNVTMTLSQDFLATG